MATVKISALPAAAPLTGVEILPIVQTGATLRSTIQEIADLVLAARLVAAVDLTAQTAAIAATTLYAVPASGVGMYRVSYSAKVTTVATTSSMLGGATGFQVKYTDPDLVVVTSSQGAVDLFSVSELNTTQAHINGAVIIYAKASTNIQYVMGYTSVGATPMAYNLHIVCETL